MVGLIICTHGRFSEELVRASEMMFGKQENMQYLTFEAGESIDILIEKYKTAIKSLPPRESILFMVDLFGGSPYNAACRIAANNERMDIVTGVNLPMLLEVYTAKNSVSISELVTLAANAGSQGIKSFRALFNNNMGDDL
ncbi:phosphotransferase system mannose-type iia component [Lucifera butyrica]|uniref:Phosphotransferase system mannose-type iia component n=1 Tax=Lucifera butyrica TaxID=1351585 RepID=A0A498R7M0_9FIRM|nr:mannose/fructose/sorbose PTS transporter subunit IIA [Lucifera butyrica]VBB07381.1 phosphotransferase system mannose-type iia component [Lucifera butyrica]